MNNQNSGKNYFLPLKHINDLLNKYSHIPDVTKIKDEEIAFIEKKIMQTRECLEKCKGKISDIVELKTIRNDIAHKKEDDIKKTKNLFEKAFPILRKIKTELENLINKTNSSNKEKRKFEKFGSNSLGTETDRKQIVSAMENTFEECRPQDKIDFPNNNFSKAIENISSQIAKSDFDYLQKHQELSENIQSEILTSASKLSETLLTENPFLEEECFIEQLKTQATEDIANSVSKVKWHYVRLPTKDSKINFKFYQNKFDEINNEIQKLNEKDIAEATKVKQKKQRQQISNKSSQQKLKHDIEVYTRNLLSDLQKSLQERKAKWQIQKIDEWRKSFLQELYKRIENFKKLEKLLTPFCKETGYLWNLSASPLKNCGFEVLRKYAELLEKESNLQELAMLLGKQEQEIEVYEKELRAKTVVKTEFHAMPAYKGELSGITLGNDISSVLPSELALLKNPLTKPLFKLKFAQKQLLSFDYISNVAHQTKQIETEEILVAKENEKGPIILCIDTSGSMQGSPELIAKTITFALAKIALKENRKCFLISFSTEIQTLDLSGDFFSSIVNLIQFLQMSFQGGTDATPALAKSLEVLGTKNYKNADVLMISDFIANILDTDLVTKIKQAQKNKTKFYSLVIGNSGNKTLIESFNENWVYDLNAKDSMKKLVRQIKTLNQPINQS